RFLGGCGLNQIEEENHRANLGYWVRSSAIGRGVATAAVRQLVQWAFNNTSLVRLEVVVSTQNAASLRVAEKSGASSEGVLKKRLLLHGIWHDAVMLSFVRVGKLSPNLL
ncbi:MAG TPA: GNAT family protein, partial [Candidatus Binatia bacterium]